MICTRLRYPLGLTAVLSITATVFGQQPEPSTDSIPVSLRVDSGTPLRLYITKRVWYRKGEIVQAKFAEPVWAFDRIVIPAGASVSGEITDLTPVPKMMRAMAMIRGDFTPLRRAQIRFTTLTLPDGRSLAIDTERSLGLSSIYVPQRGKTAQPAKAPNPQPPAENQSKTGWMRSFIKQQAVHEAHAQANARTRGLFDFVRGPNKREWIENYLWSQLPYHPQFYRSGTRFDAILEHSLDFGEVNLAGKTLQRISPQPPPDSSGLVRSLSTISSGDAKVGDPIAAILTQPVFSADHQLLLPEGTHLTGKVTLARHASMFHRSGQLRFIFNNLEIPAAAAAAATAPAPRFEATQAQVTAAEATAGPASVDPEGTAKITESKTRFLRPVIAGLVAVKSMDNDTGKQTASGGGNTNFTGQSLGGFSGFGLFGALVAQGPQEIGMALGYYGLAWSVYGTVVSRGKEVVFEKNAAMAIRFGATGKQR